MIVLPAPGLGDRTFEDERVKDIPHCHFRAAYRTVLCGLTFELSGRRRQDARPGLAKMYRVPPDRAWWPAVGAPLERGVRPRGFTE